MDFGDIMTLTCAYAGFAAGVFCATYGAAALYAFFKSLGAADFKNDN